MQHSLVINSYTDRVYIKYGVDAYVSFLDKYHTKILKETDAKHAAWLLGRYKYYMNLLMEDMYKLVAKGSVDNHERITRLMDTVYFMYTQAHEHILTLKWIS